MTAGDTELVGTLVAGRYRLERVIGHGSTGRIYEATQEPLGRRVAVKVLEAHLTRDASALERFRREALAVAQLGHPNVVRVIELVADGPQGRPALVMEHLGGETLGQRLRRGPMSVAEAVDVGRQLLAALEAAHEVGIVHRDLKPANVFLTPLADGRTLVKVLDFGLVKLAEDETEGLTQTGVMLGTPRWSAPEQLTSARRADARADLYSMGALLFAMLTGRPPFDAPRTQAVADVIQRPPPRLRDLAPHVPESLERLIHDALAKDPAARPPDAATFRIALEATPAASPPLAGRRPIAAALIGLAAAALIGACLIAAVVVAMWDDDADPRAVVQPTAPGSTIGTDQETPPAPPDRSAEGDILALLEQLQPCADQWTHMTPPSGFDTETASWVRWSVPLGGGTPEPGSIRFDDQSSGEVARCTRRALEQTRFSTASAGVRRAHVSFHASASFVEVAPTWMAGTSYFTGRTGPRPVRHLMAHGLPRIALTTLQGGPDLSVLPLNTSGELLVAASPDARVVVFDAPEAFWELRVNSQTPGQRYVLRRAAPE